MRSLLLPLLAAGLAAGCAPHLRQPHLPPPALYSASPAPSLALPAALRTASSTGKRVLLVFGADWCSDSRAMHRRLTTDPTLAPLVTESFHLVLVDVGERHGPLWDAPVVQTYGQPFQDRGIPALVVLDPDGTQLTHRDNNPLVDSDHRRPRRLRAFLQRWAPPRPGS
ncbi:MAG: thioredoxin family protein [Verrucomicrobiales bacterium]|nr:thioredoxin family protein [Verrucomicrobiales bacterium]